MKKNLYRASSTRPRTRTASTTGSSRLLGRRTTTTRSSRRKPPQSRPALEEEDSPSHHDIRRRQPLALLWLSSYQQTGVLKQMDHPVSKYMYSLLCTKGFKIHQRIMYSINIRCCLYYYNLRLRNSVLPS